MVRAGISLLRSWRTSIYQAFRSAQCEQGGKENIRIQGWVKSVRNYKHFLFVDVNDGSSHRNLQVVASADLFPIDQSLSLGCSVLIEGQMVPSSHPKQDFEMSATKLQILGECNSKEYPFKARTYHSLDYSRIYTHLRARTSTFAALLRVRNTATTAIHDYFQRHEFLHVHTPVLTSSDCEGGGDVFRVSRVQDTNNERSYEFFNAPVYLTVSGQLHAEAVTCGGMSKVYTFGPTFRAEKSHTRRHLAEFNMVEAEMVTDHEHSLEEIVEVIESLCKHTTEAVLSKSSEDVKLFHQNAANPTIKEDVANMLDKPFKRITYTEAVDILKQKRKEDGVVFNYLPKWGSDLHNEHEQCLVKHFDNQPVFVMEYPMEMKPFYARSKDDEDTIALSADLLMPNVGEVAGGTVREERCQVLTEKLRSLQQSNEYQWYLDLRRYGTVSHGGFGLGFERLIQALLGVQNIRDTIPFPRFLQSCPM